MFDYNNYFFRNSPVQNFINIPGSLISPFWTDIISNTVIFVFYIECSFNFIYI